MVDTVIFLTTGTTTWAVPADWSAVNKIECIGAGGGGRTGTGAAANAGGGGGGGGYGRAINVAGLTGTLNVSIGAGGGPSVNGGDTWFNGSSVTVATVSAQGGRTPTAVLVGGVGGATATGIGPAAEFAGGTGGAGAAGVTGGGGGGAAGPGGVGGNGGPGDAATAGNDFGGSGGGGAGLTGAGGLGGTGGTSAGAAGAAGAGGGGIGGVGGAGAGTQGAVGSGVWTSTLAVIAAPGGGGGGGGSAAGVGGAGQSYGGGGGGTGTTSVAGTGAPGLIVITYTPAIPPPVASGPIQVKHGGTWKKATSQWAKVSGTWKEAEAYVRHAGTWKPLVEVAVPPTLDLDFTTGTLDSKVTFTRTTTATYTNSSGVLSSAAIDAPRFDYNPATLAARGLLLEEQRTNLLLQSEAFNTTWGSTSTVTANQTTAPDGTMTGDKITLTTGGQYTQQNIYPGPSGTHAFSVYAKAGNTNFALVKLQQWGTPHYAVIVDLTTGLVTKTQGGIGVGSPAYKVENAGSGWWRIAIFATADGVGTVPTVSPAVTGTDALSGYGDLAAGDSTSFAYFWGAQFEAGAFATSYIPTTTAAVTRAADRAVMSGTNFSSWWTQSAGTIVFDAEFHNVNQGSRLAEFDNGVDNGGRIAFLGNNYTRLHLYTDTGGSLFANATTGDLVGNTPFKWGVAFAASDNATAVNGGTVSTAANSIPAATARVGLSFSQPGGGDPTSGHMRRFRFYNVRKSNAELQALTT